MNQHRPISNNGHHLFLASLSFINTPFTIEGIAFSRWEYMMSGLVSQLNFYHKIWSAVQLWQSEHCQEKS